jgi:hypothetical protein
MLLDPVEVARRNAYGYRDGRIVVVNRPASDATRRRHVAADLAPAPSPLAGSQGDDLATARPVEPGADDG